LQDALAAVIAGEVDAKTKGKSRLNLVEKTMDFTESPGSNKRDSFAEKYVSL